MAIYKATVKLVITLCVLSVAVVGQSRAASSSVVINTEPNAIVWIDEIRRGTTDASGRIELKVLPGRHAVRVRANGFKEAAAVLLPGRRTLAVKLVRTTREWNGIARGAGPRACIALLAAARAYALVKGNTFVTPDDVKTMYLPALRHRILLSPELAIEGVDADRVLQSVMQHVEAPRH